MKYILSIVPAFLFTLSVYSQTHKYLPSQIRVGTDLSYLGLSVLSKEKSQFEINADIDFNRFLVIGDYGYASWRFADTDYEYNNSGSYFRIGLDYNFVRPDENQNAIYLGFRYAGADFNENFSYEVQDPFYGDYSNDIQDLKRNGSWLELAAGMKIRVWKGLFLGWTGRFKFASGISSPPSTFNNFWIPGYGKTSRDSRWGLNYQIFYRFPLFRKNYKPADTAKGN